QIQAMNIYSHEARGSFRLGIYDENLNCLWRSGEIQNTAADEWLSININLGKPEILVLNPGMYLLSWQLSEDGNIPSVTQYTNGSGLYSIWPFSPFPDEVISHQESNGLWSIYADCLAHNPTCTPTSPTPSFTPTSTATPTFTPTSTATMSPTMTVTPQSTNTQQPTATQRPGSGAEIRLSQTEYYPGDNFKLDLFISNVNPVPRNVSLYLLLDVYGAYWFGPGWSQNLEFYEISDLLGSQNIPIFDFIWPEILGYADGLRFWSAMLEQETQLLFGYYDMVEFGYNWNNYTPVPTGTPTPEITNTQGPTQTSTPTVNPGHLEVILLNDDPMSYSGEACDSPEVFCFSPERVAFCSEWRSIVMLFNPSEIAVEVSLETSGPEWMEFDLEESEMVIYSGQTRYVRLRFCPLSPPDLLKQAILNLSWLEENMLIEVKGWSVAG
ncbi:hypothetical protein K8T06_05400, partial [bacterium]|nr:hypothetical protein [bacterium]